MGHLQARMRSASSSSLQPADRACACSPLPLARSAPLFIRPTCCQGIVARCDNVAAAQKAAGAMACMCTHLTHHHRTLLHVRALGWEAAFGAGHGCAMCPRPVAGALGSTPAPQRAAPTASRSCRANPLRSARGTSTLARGWWSWCMARCPRRMHSRWAGMPPGAGRVGGVAVPAPVPHGRAGRRMPCWRGIPNAPM